MSKARVLGKVRRHLLSHQQLWNRVTAVTVLLAAVVVVGVVVVMLRSVP